MDTLDRYKKLVDFLGEIMGENTEVVLRDCRKPDHDIIAIANGNVSGRTVGAPITDFTLSILANEEWKERDYVVNYEGKAAANKRLRSSTYFIREEGELIGQLCINIDMGPYEKLLDEVKVLSGLDLIHSVKAGQVPGPTENFSEDVMEDMIQKAVIQTVGSCDSIVRERLTQQDRLQIISELNDAGLFHLKGAVGAVAEYLYCSEASVYRYQSKLQKKSSGDVVK